jgi:hypothetical protein
MLERLWIAAITVFAVGWVIVFADAGSEIGGIAVYASTAVLLVLGVVAAARWISGRLTST